MGNIENVSRETRDRLDALKGILTHWNKTLNLVAPMNMDLLDTRHFEDSAQLIAFIPKAPVHWVDLGAGGGFPGLVVAALLSELSPGSRMTLVEADKRKSVFLRQAAREMDLEVAVLAERIENTRGLAANVISARALAPLTTLCAYVERHIEPGGVSYLFKGANHLDEVEKARTAGWRFDLATHNSETSAEGAILEVRNLRRAAE